MLLIVSAERRRQLAQSALVARREAFNRLIAVIAVGFYNLVGFADIISTGAGISSGVAQEVNPLMLAAMEHFGPGWIGVKLLLQAVISLMVLWFPHRIVIGIFLLAVMLNTGVVLNNIKIVYGF